MSITSHSPEHEGPSKESLAAGYEVSDARRRPLLLGTVGIFLVLLVSFVLIATLLFVAGRAPGDTSNTLPADAEVQLQLPAEPRIEQNPNIDGTRIVNEANAQLESYGWVNERAGTAHIPIDRAMNLILERGVGPQGGQ